MLIPLLLAGIFVMTFLWVRNHKPAIIVQFTQAIVDFIHQNYKLFLLIGLLSGAWATYNFMHSKSVHKVDADYCKYQLEYRVVVEENSACKLRTIVVKDARNADQCTSIRSGCKSGK